MTDFTVEQVRRLRVSAQYLSPRNYTGLLGDVVAPVGGIQAQQMAAMMLALRARYRGIAVDRIEDTIRRRELVRTWLMRGTLHLAAAADIRWMLSLLSPGFITSGKRRRLQLGLTDEVSAKGLDAIRAILHGSAPLTRGEIVERLAEHRVGLDRRSQAPIHLIGLAALEGIVCLGPDAPNGESTYVYMDEWIEPADVPSRDEALALLLWRYLIGYAPASLKDFSAWSGLPMLDAKRGWALLQEHRDPVIEVRVEDRTLLALTNIEPSPEASAPLVRLLPAFDTYILGYADRDYVVAPEHQSLVYHGGQTVPVVLVDGAAAGVWRYRRQGRRLHITIHLFSDTDSRTRDGVAQEADDIGRFWDVSASVLYSAEPV